MPLNDQVSDGISRILERMTPEERAEFMTGAETNPDTEAVMEIAAICAFINGRP